MSIPSTTVSLVLHDGIPDGRRYAQFNGLVMRVHAFPKSQFKNVQQEISRAGVYLIYGANVENGKNTLYIGQSSDVAARLKTYTASKDFWEETLVLVSQTDSLTKSDIEYIEAKLIADAATNPSWELANEKLTKGTSPKAINLPHADMIDMNNFLSSAKTLIRMLGCDVFKPTSGHLLKGNTSIDKNATGVEFQFYGNGYDAKAVMLPVSGEWVIKANSKAKLEIQGHVSDTIKKSRQELKDAGILIESQGFLIFQQDCQFNSASSSATMICGSATNGKKAWKTESGVSFANWENTQIV